MANQFNKCKIRYMGNLLRYWDKIPIIGAVKKPDMSREAR